MQGAFAQNVLPTVGAVPTYVACAVGGTAAGGAALTTMPTTTLGSGALPVVVQVRATVKGYTLATFNKAIFLAALAQTLSVNLGQLSLLSVVNARRRDAGGVVATTNVGYPTGTDPTQVRLS